jgi:hypothetical protein
MKHITFIILFLLFFINTKSKNNKVYLSFGSEFLIYYPSKLIVQINNDKLKSSFFFSNHFINENQKSESLSIYNYKSLNGIDIGFKKYFFKFYGPNSRIFYRKYIGKFKYEVPGKYGPEENYFINNLDCAVLSLGYYKNIFFNNYGIFEISINGEVQFFIRGGYSYWKSSYFTRPSYFPINFQLIYHFKRNKRKEQKSVP